ncbi:MAG: ATP-binding cassette domain-containing protein [Burkholderiales bacterium]|nr:ATP-binding cassette domain-containing protein [Burkholderiales bacterium]
MVALIGPNGAGKTSFIGALTGAVASKGRGRARRDAPRRPADLPAHPASAWPLCPITAGCSRRSRSPRTSASARCSCSTRAARRSCSGRWRPFLSYRSAAPRLAGSLSGGQQQMLAIAKCLAGDPKALLLDEPSQGLAPVILDEIVKVIGELKARRLPVLLVEQNYGLVERTADRFAVMVGGRLVLTGGKTELADRDRIGRLFLERRRTTPFSRRRQGDFHDDDETRGPGRGGGPLRPGRAGGWPRRKAMSRSRLAC